MNEMRKTRTGTPPTCASRQDHELERLRVGIEVVAKLADELGAFRPAERGDRPFLGDARQVDLQVGPLGLQIVLKLASTRAAPPVVVVMWK